MPYLPKSNPQDTVFPTIGLDVAWVHNTLLEKWKRFYPIVSYYQIDVTPTVAVSDGNVVTDMVTGIAGKTRVDDLWGEDVIVNNNDWIQPHSTVESPLADSTNTRIFKEVVLINVHVNLEPTEQLLRRMGIEEEKVILATFPLVLLDEKDVIVSVGDIFKWGGTTYEILTNKFTGYWKMTNHTLYMTCTARRWKYGS